MRKTDTAYLTCEYYTTCQLASDIRKARSDFIEKTGQDPTCLFVPDIFTFITALLDELEANRLIVQGGRVERYLGMNVVEVPTLQNYVVCRKEANGN